MTGCGVSDAKRTALTTPQLIVFLVTVCADVLYFFQQFGSDFFILFKNP